MQVMKRNVLSDSPSDLYNVNTPKENFIKKFSWLDSVIIPFSFYFTQMWKVKKANSQWEQTCNITRYPPSSS